MTLKDDGITLIVLNPSHVPSRQPNNLMHELAHIELNHQPARVDVSETGLLLLSDYSDDQELEADWHAGALLVPREGLLKMRTQGASIADIASYFGVSELLCQWRLRMTGVDAQMRRRRS
jgi:Zn-dependent peptidase ImmA (M78 family)